MATGPSPKPSLEDATNTDEVYDLAYRLAAWGLSNGECDEYSAVDWVLDHPHEAKLPRGSRGTLNPTRHHITQGAQRAADQYAPGVRTAEFDPEPLHELAARISGSGVNHEKYLLGVVALCLKYETLTPVITGPNLAEVVGVHEQAAYKVLRQWSTTRAYGFFTGVSYDGIRGHGRVWTVDPDWVPRSRPKHLPGCNRSKSRCQCPGLSQKGISIFSAEKDSYTKVRQSGAGTSPPRQDPSAEFAEWISTLPAKTPLDATAVARQLGVTRHAATKLLREQEGGLLAEGTCPSGWTSQKDPDGRRRRARRGETWFVA